jgi:hypothetical protein
MSPLKHSAVDIMAIAERASSIVPTIGTQLPHSGGLALGVEQAKFDVNLPSWGRLLGTPSVVRFNTFMTTILLLLPL